MSILVKDMVMPTNCMDCFFHKKDKITMCGDKDCDYKVKIVYTCLFKPDEIEDGWVGIDIASRKRQEWCPLEEKKYGYWLEDSYGHIICSACKTTRVTSHKSKYCSYCGAEIKKRG